MAQYELTGSPSDYEEDHLILLELGGAPRNEDLPAVKHGGRRNTKSRDDQGFVAVVIGAGPDVRAPMARHGPYRPATTWEV